MLLKNLSLSNTELKFSDDSRTFEGYASMFNGVDSYGDTVLPGAYEKTLKNRDRPIRMRWNHFGPVIGKWTDFKEDDYGLWVRGELTPGHSVAEDAYASAKHGAVDGLSIGYQVGDYEKQGDITLLKEIDLVEISLVEEPADLGARVSDVKHLNEMIAQCDSYKEIEALLREAGGFSRSTAVGLVSRIKALHLGEQEQKGSIDLNLACEYLRTK